MFVLQALGLASLLALASTQTVDPASVPLTTREIWCNDQIASCPLICLQLPGATGDPLANDCDPATLAYSCVCSNNMSPNETEFSQTIPYYECTEFANQCAADCGAHNDACVSNCRTAHPCGAQNPKRYNITTSTTMSSTATASASEGVAATDTGVYTGFGSAPTSSAASTPNAASLSRGSPILGLGLAETYGALVLVGSFIAGFAILL